MATGAPHDNVVSGNVLVSGYDWPAGAELVIKEAGIAQPASATQAAG